MTVTVAPLVTPGDKTRSEVIAIATAKIWDECLFIEQLSRLGRSNNPL
jgi:hypothetical protein